MDRGTFCISCHTAMPYALARPAVRTMLGEKDPSPVERQLLASIATRVQHWGEEQPYLGDKAAGPGYESVLNAWVLTANESRADRMTDLTRQALRIMWSEQIKTGPNAGSWRWASFGNEPWEAPDSDYWGATAAALATGTAPEGYASSAPIQNDLNLLRTYLQRDWQGQSLFNQISLLSASTRVPGLLNSKQKTQIVAEVLAKQQSDGGWSTASLMPATWKRRDGSPEHTESDGYATGLVANVLESTGNAKALRKALSWLVQNQDRSTGSWPAESPNVARDHVSDAGKFMTDAATGYAVLALAGEK